MVLFTTFLWGSWSQFIKKIGKWPIAAFMLWLYIAGFAVTSVSMIFLKSIFVPEGIATLVRAMPQKCLLVFVCGATFAAGVQINMMVVSKAGLIFSTSIMAMLSIPVGCTVSSFFGGIPENVSVLQIVLGVALLVTATLLCQKATRMRDRDTREFSQDGEKARLRYMLILLVCAVVFAPTYTLALSIGTRTEGGKTLPTVLLVWILSAGSLVGTALVSGVRLSRARQWGEFAARRNLRYIGYACLSGLFHYGGTLIHTIASPVVSVAIAWPLGYLSNIGQYFWGMVRGEFRGAYRRTWLTLFSGIVCFVLALITLASALYW